MNGREASGEDLVWFSVMPADLSGKKLTVEVVTETNIYRKEIDFTNKTLKFEAARVSEFIISGLTPVKTRRLQVDDTDFRVEIWR